MAQKNLNARISWRRDTDTNWISANPVLLNGEIIIVDTDDGNIRFKIGDGNQTYAQLPFEDEAIRNLIDTKSAVTLETWNNADNADSSITIGNLTINKIKSKEIYDAMRAAGKVDENELYLIEDENPLPIEITSSLTTGVEIGTIAVNGNTYTFYAPDSFALPVATEDTLGGIKSGGDITVDDNGIVSVNKASAENDGLMSSEDKAKLDDIVAGAEVNVQADWNENDTTSDAYINNRTHWVDSSFGVISENVYLWCARKYMYMEGGSQEIANLNLNSGDRMVLTLTCNGYNDVVIDTTFVLIEDGFNPVTGTSDPFWGGGELSYFEHGSDTGFPYSIVYEPISSNYPSKGGYFTIYFHDSFPYNNNDSIAVKVEGNTSVYHKLDKRFIPEQNVVSATENGLMSFVDKAKLDAVPTPENIATITTVFDSILLKDATTGETYMLQMRNGNLVSDLYTTN